MAAKRVTDITSHYEGTTAARPATNAERARFRKAAQRLSTGKLEKDVEALLVSKGVNLDSTVADAVKDLGRGPRLPPRRKGGAKKKAAKAKAPKRKAPRKKAARRRKK